MMDEILREVTANIEYLAFRLRRWAIGLVSMIIFGWMIIGSTVVGLVLVAYISRQIAKTERSRIMMESPGRFEQKAKQPLAPVNPVVKKNLQIVPSIRNGSQANQLSLSEGIRNFSGIVNEARNLARSLSR